MSLPERSLLEPPPFPADAWMDARVEAYVDDALPEDERAAFEARLPHAPRWQAAVRCAREMRDALRMAPQPACPPAVTQAVLRTAQNEQTAPLEAPRAERHARAPVRERRGATARAPRAWQPPLALALLLVLSAAAALLGQPAAPTHAFTPAQVQRAQAEAEWTLAFLARVTHETGTTVREDVLVERVARPTQQATLRALRHVPARSSPASSLPR